MANGSMDTAGEVGSQAEAAPDGLYRGLLGAAWAGLDPAVQWVHAGPATVRADGIFQVTRAVGWLLGRVLDMAGVPPAGDAVPVRLTIQRRGPIERWHRSFGGRPLVTFQRAAPDGRLIERMGALELRFLLIAEERALRFQQERLAVCLGAWRLPVPGWLALRVDGFAGPSGSADRASVLVEVRGPTGGVLFGYRGTIGRARHAGEASE